MCTNYIIQEFTDASKCVATENCEKCLLADETCAWCADPVYYISTFNSFMNIK